MAAALSAVNELVINFNTDQKTVYHDKTYMKISFQILILFGLLVPDLSYSQNVNFKIGISDSIQSSILGEDRQLIVSLPKDYDTSKNAYPVLYILDGNETGILDAITVTRKLSAEMIIVAIPNTDRDRDMMPLSTPTYQVDNQELHNFSSSLKKS